MPINLAELSENQISLQICINWVVKSQCYAGVSPPGPFCETS